MPQYRYVIASVEDLGGNILKKFPIKVEHLQSNSSPDGVFFPKRTDTFYTNNAGLARFRLWCNEEGDTSSVYRFTMPNGDIFDTVIPIGEIDIDISALRNGATPTARPQYVTLISHLKRELGSALLPATSLLAGVVKTNTTSVNPVVYLKSEIDDLITQLTGVDFSDYYTKNEILSLYYSKTAIDTLLSNLDVDLSAYYSKTEVDELIEGIQAGTVDLTNYYTKSQVDNLIPSPVDLTDYYTKSEVDNIINSWGLNQLVDVTITSPANGQALVYQSGQWVNQNVSSGGGSSAPGNILNMVYDSANRLTSYTLDGTPYTVTYGTNTQVITGGGTTQTITYDSANNVISKVTV